MTMKKKSPRKALMKTPALSKTTRKMKTAKVRTLESKKAPRILPRPVGLLQAQNVRRVVRYRRRTTWKR